MQPPAAWGEGGDWWWILTRMQILEKLQGRMSRVCCVKVLPHEILDLVFRQLSLQDVL